MHFLQVGKEAVTHKAGNATTVYVIAFVVGKREEGKFLILLRIFIVICMNCIQGRHTSHKQAQHRYFGAA